jgi:predicted DNA-binding transcriptional regulator YafY
LVKQLKRAILHQQHVQVIYLGRDGQITTRILRPLEIAGDRLKAYCLTRKAPRIFAIDNILAVEPVGHGRAG